LLESRFGLQHYAVVHALLPISRRSGSSSPQAGSQRCLSIRCSALENRQCGDHLIAPGLAVESQVI
jgi:hypothetical protein